jgi:hypothetical protein
MGDGVAAKHFYPLLFSPSSIEPLRRYIRNMDADRKYRQSGYQDSDRPSNAERKDGQRPPRPSGPRTLQDPAGPRLPRLVQSVTASRCFSCSVTLPSGTDFKAPCPKCGAALHCCKQCTFFEPSTRFQCTKPIPARIPYKDQANECELFNARVTVSRDGASGSSNGPATPGAKIPAPVIRTPSDARTAFDNLFKK